MQYRCNDATSGVTTTIHPRSAARGSIQNWPNESLHRRRTARPSVYGGMRHRRGHCATTQPSHLKRIVLTSSRNRVSHCPARTGGTEPGPAYISGRCRVGTTKPAPVCFRCFIYMDRPDQSAAVAVGRPPQSTNLWSSRPQWPRGVCCRSDTASPKRMFAERPFCLRRICRCGFQLVRVNIFATRR